MDGTRSALAEARRVAGLTQEELAERAGLSVRNISNIERGRVSRPRRGSLEALATALGLDPGRRDELIAHYRRGTAMPDGVRPAQLPPARATFTGRASQLDRLDRELAAGPTIVIIDGTAGAGKTALAVHWGHRVSDRFPDGQLYVDLHGFGPTPPADPRAVLDDWIRVLGPDVDGVPSTLEASAALYRSLLAGRQLLIVLDNARSAEQVRPLLPPGPGCFVVVTSRDELRGLATREGARRVGVGPLELGEATELLARSIGADRVELEPRAAAEIAERCGRLPLAVSIVSDRAVRDHGFVSLTSISAELAEVSARLDVLDARDGDPATSVRGVCSWSYDALDADAARMFRTLALHPGDDFDVPEAAALAKLSAVNAHLLLDRLTAGHLLERAAAGRWTFHDLLREYAAELAVSLDAEGVRAAALDRLFEHYLGELAAVPDVESGGLESEWLGSHRTNVLAGARRAAEVGRVDFAVAVSAALARHLDGGGFHNEAKLLHGYAALTDDPVAASVAYRRLGVACDRLGQSREALAHFRRAMELARASGEDFVALSASLNVGIAHWRLGELDLAAAELVGCLALAREGDHEQVEAAVLGTLGLVSTSLGDYPAAIEHHTRAAAMNSVLGHTVAAANDIDELGCAYRLSGQYDAAEQHHLRALSLYREVGYREGEADALSNLGTARAALGALAEAIDHQSQALRLARDLGSPRIIAKALNGLAEARLRTGSATTAVALHEQALTVLTDVSAPGEVARTHDGLGCALHDLGRHPEAVEHWRTALAEYEQMGSPHAATVRQRLTPFE